MAVSIHGGKLYNTPQKVCSEWIGLGAFAVSKEHNIYGGIYGRQVYIEIWLSNSCQDNDVE